VSDHPTLLHGCAAASSAEEASFRIQRPVETHRSARVIALDGPATAVTDALSGREWQAARFLTGHDAAQVSGNGEGPDPLLRASDGQQLPLSRILEGADVVVMVATTDDGAALAAVIGEACDERRITTAGLVIDTDRRLSAAVSALRPHAQVLLVSDDASDVAELLSALRV
jgi:hypothetical protein